MQGSGADGIVGAIMNADSQQDMQAIIREQVWGVWGVWSLGTAYCSAAMSVPQQMAGFEGEEGPRVCLGKIANWLPYSAAPPLHASVEKGKGPGA